MRNILAAAVVAMAGLAGSASALTVTFDFVATGFTGSNAALLAAIGSGGVTGRITYDDAAGVDAGSYFGPDDYRTTFVRFPGSLSLTINGTTYEAMPPTRVLSSDTDSNLDYVDTVNLFEFGSDTFVGPGGVAQSLFEGFRIAVTAPGATSWDGVTPTVAQLNAAYLRQARFYGEKFADTKNVTFSSPVVAPVPLPAGGVLLLSAMAGLALLRRRRAWRQTRQMAGQGGQTGPLQGRHPVVA